jgi:hypothetical protein
MAKDVFFLQSNNLMDYSLFVGVHQRHEHMNSHPDSPDRLARKVGSTVVATIYESSLEGEALAHMVQPDEQAQDGAREANLARHSGSEGQAHRSSDLNAVNQARRPDIKGPGKHLNSGSDLEQQAHAAVSHGRHSENDRHHGAASTPSARSKSAPNISKLSAQTLPSRQPCGDKAGGHTHAQAPSRDAHAAPNSGIAKPSDVQEACARDVEIRTDQGGSYRLAGTRSIRSSVDMQAGALGTDSDKGSGKISSDTMSGNPAHGSLTPGLTHQDDRDRSPLIEQQHSCAELGQRETPALHREQETEVEQADCDPGHAKPDVAHQQAGEPELDEMDQNLLYPKSWWRLIDLNRSQDYANQGLEWKLMGLRRQYAQSMDSDIELNSRRRRDSSSVYGSESDQTCPPSTVSNHHTSGATERVCVSLTPEHYSNTTLTVPCSHSRQNTIATPR